MRLAIAALLACTAPAAADDATPIASTWVLASLGAHTGDFDGGNADVQLGFGGRSVWGIAGLHAAGGVGPNSGNGFGVASTYLGIRSLGRMSSGLTTTASVAAGAGYIHEQEGEREYAYVWPHARVSLGILHGTGARPGFGIELVGRAGYAFDTTASLHEADYSSFWKSLELNLAFSL